MTHTVVVVVVSIVVVVVVTLTRIIIKSGVTGQAAVSHSGVEKYPTQTKPKVVHAYIMADAIHASI